MCLLSQKATRLPWFLTFLQGSSWKIKVYLNLLRSGKPLVSKTGIALSSYVLKKQSLNSKAYPGKDFKKMNKLVQLRKIFI